MSHDHATRTSGIRAAVAFLENALRAKAPDIKAVIAGFGEERVDEYRIRFYRDDEGEVARKSDHPSASSGPGRTYGVSSAGRTPLTAS